jgi:hypothetical protein
MHVKIETELAEVDGPRLVFHVSATDKYGTLVGSGIIERVIVDREPCVASAIRWCQGSGCHDLQVRLTEPVGFPKSACPCDLG